MGRARIPMEKREIEGTVRASNKKRAAGTPEVQIITIESCPGLSKNAMKHWPFFREMFSKFPVVAQTDMAAVQRLVETYAEVRLYMAVLEKEGHFVISSTRHGDNHRAHPAVGALQDADRRFRAYMTDFGMTPSARTKVKGEGNGNAPKDPLADFGI